MFERGRRNSAMMDWIFEINRCSYNLLIYLRNWINLSSNNKHIKWNHACQWLTGLFPNVPLSSPCLPEGFTKWTKKANILFFYLISMLSQKQNWKTRYSLFRENACIIFSPETFLRVCCLFPHNDIHNMRMEEYLKSIGNNN